MNEVVLDTSVILAAFNGEIEDESLLDRIEGSVMSAVNVAELFTKLNEMGVGKTPKFMQLMALLGRVEDFTEAQAELTGALHSLTRAQGLSLGDRACLALALELGADVYTADRIWSKVEVGCAIHLIR